MARLVPCWLWLLAGLLTLTPAVVPGRLLAPAPFDEALSGDGPGGVTRVEVTDRTRVYLDGRRVRYEAVPRDAWVTELELGPDGRTATLIRFERRKRP